MTWSTITIVLAPIAAPFLIAAFLAWRTAVRKRDGRK
jgi:hypothetical protein